MFDSSPEAHARVSDIARELERAQNWITSEGRPASMEGLDLRPASSLFRNRLLAGMRAKGVIAIGVDFTETQLQGANFEGAALRAANFTGADLRGVSFLNAKLSHASFQGADISPLHLRPGRSLATRFDGATLAGTGLAPSADSPGPATA